MKAEKAIKKDSKTRILHLIKSLGRGGAEKLIPETAKVHNQKNYQFYCLYFYHQKNNIVEELEDSGIKVELIPSGNLGLFFQVQRVRNFIWENQIDIIHAHLPWAGILSRQVGKSLNIPIVYTEHNTWDRYNSISYWGNRLTFKKQDVAIAVSNEVALSMQLNSIFDPYQRGGRLKVKVIQNGVNTDEFRRIGIREKGLGYSEKNIHTSEVRGRLRDGETERLENRDPESYRDGDGEIRRHNDFSDMTSKSLIPLVSESLASGYEISPSFDNRNDEIGKLKLSLNIPEESPVIGKVAVFRSQKRLWIWVDLALKILEMKPETHFLLVGDGEWRERIKEQIQTSGFGHNFHLVGVQKEVIPYLSIMDIYLSTSEFEGLPIAMLEAMSCEVPVVATRAGGIGEIIQHGKQGYLSEIDEYEDLVEHCLTLLENEDQRMSMASAARQRVVDEFSMKRMVEEIEGVYESVLN